MPTEWRPDLDRVERSTNRPRGSRGAAGTTGHPRPLEPISRRDRLRTGTWAKAPGSGSRTHPGRSSRRDPHGAPSDATRWSYKQRRKELLLALLDNYADAHDDAIQEIGAVVDYLREAGIRGYMAAKTNDDDLTYPPEDRTNQRTPDPNADHPDGTAPDDTPKDREVPRGTA